MDRSQPRAPRGGPVAEVAALFLKLGLTAFGGPTAHVALMQREAVERRGWMTNERFLDLLGASNLLPGPTSTEMAMLLGRARAGIAGLVVAGVMFILPAAVMVGAFAWAYVAYGSAPQISWLLLGVQPVVLAIVVQALASLARTAVTGAVGLGVTVAAAAAFVLAVEPLAVLAGAALIVLVARNARPPTSLALRVAGVAPDAAGMIGPWSAAAARSAPELGLLFLTFLKIGAIVYGSGYVLIAFLRADLVDGLGWVTDRQLIDAVAVGQLTPGPIFTTATFLGYLLAGLPGAVAATVAVFLPAFGFAALVEPIVTRIRSSPWTSALLDGVTLGALGLMLGVALQLGRVAVVDPLTALIAAAALVLLVRFRVDAVWLIAAGALVGLGYELATSPS